MFPKELRINYLSNFLDDKFNLNLKCSKLQALYLTFREEKNTKAIFTTTDSDVQPTSELELKEHESSKCHVESKLRANAVSPNPFMTQEKSSFRKEDRRSIFRGDTMSACSINDEIVMSNHVSPIRNNSESKARK
jgi:hypothetical protein